MSLFLLALLACSPDPAVFTGSAEPRQPQLPHPAPEQPVVPLRPLVQVPSEPALKSFTGQATHLGAGLWCAFYPLGWSDDGRFAWAVERRANDMALEYGASWRVMAVGATVAEEHVGWSAEDFPEDAQLAWAWSNQTERVERLLTEHKIMAGGTELLPLPVDTPAGRLEARWELGEIEDTLRPARLLIRWDVGPEQAIVETLRSDIAPEPQPPALMVSPTGHHAALVVPVVRGEPVEALVDVEYRVHGLELGTSP